MRAQVVVLPGDGIGPEVIDAALGVMRAAAGRFEIELDVVSKPVGGAALRAGLPPLPDDTLAACRGADAVLLGAVGDPQFDEGPRDRRPETALLALRKALGVFANLRPALVWPGLEDAGPFRPEKIRGTDMLIVRELTGGLYFGEPRGMQADGSWAVNTLRYSAEEVERVAHVAFDAARKRRCKVTSVDKANVLETSQLWREVVGRVAAGYPDVTVDHLYVDACAMMIALDPTRFDVIVTENLFGDILSDEAGAVAGSLGLLPSASLGRGTAIYEPVHGSAPALAGKDTANPIGAIASVAMLFELSIGHAEAAEAIRRAIGSVIIDGPRTADLARPGETPAAGSAVGRAIAGRVGSNRG